MEETVTISLGRYNSLMAILPTIKSGGVVATNSGYSFINILSENEAINELIRENKELYKEISELNKTINKTK